MVIAFIFKYQMSTRNGFTSTVLYSDRSVTSRIRLGSRFKNYIEKSALYDYLKIMENRSKAEHITLFSGITIAVIKCLYDDKLKNIGHGSISPYVIATILILSVAAVVKILYQLQFIHCSDKHIRRNQGDKGLFCILLLPIAFIFSCINCEDLSSEYKAVTLISFELALSSIIVLLFQALQQKYFQNVLSAVTIVTLLTSGLLYFYGVCYIELMFLSVLSQCLLFWLLDTVSTSFSQSFTIGELNLVCQAIVVFLVSACFHFSALVHRYETKAISPVSSMIFIAMTGLLIVFFLLRYFVILQSTVNFYVVCIGLAGASIFTAMGVAFQQNPLLWFWSFISESEVRILLMFYFIVCSGLTFLFIAWQQTRSEQSSTVTRKFFHGVAIAIYIPAFVFDPELLLLASSMIFGIFSLLECIRVLKIFPLGNIIQNAFSIFLDEKDSGVLMLTHLYLFLGCSVTLWIHPFNYKAIKHVCVTSGILALGFGDSAASIVGTFFGKHKWPHTKKTYEGTLSALAIQFFGTLCMLFLLKQFCSVFNLAYVLIATAHSVLLETFTTQVDNLVLPFYLYIMFVCI